MHETYVSVKMNRSSSSSTKIHNHKKCPESEVPKTMGRKKRREKLGSSSSNLSSSSGSIEAPKGCLRFLLSHTSSSSSITTPAKATFSRKCSTVRTAHFGSKTPKSAPIARLPHSKRFPLIKDKSFTKPTTHKLERVPKSRKPISEITLFQDSSNSAPIIKLHPASQHLLKATKEELQFTPVVSSKFPACSTLDCRVAVTENHKNVITEDDKSCTSSDKTKTPPIQASFSPEIQSSTISAATPACYGAGHLVSGVTDRRKCKARGVLTVAMPSDNERVDPQEDCATENVNQSSISMFPSPAEASMHWLLSPCGVGDEDDKENSAPLQALIEPRMLPSPSSPLSDLHLSLDMCNLSTSGSTKSQRITNNMLISPQLPQFQVHLDSLCDYALDSSSPNATPNSGAVTFKEKAMNCYNIDGGNSPFSTDTLGSENVMQTPNSDSSLERHVELSYSNENDSKRHYSYPELLSLAGDLQNTILSPASGVSIWDTTSSSFQFQHSSSPCNSMDISPIQKLLDDHSLWTSTSTFDNVSLSQMKISWREGLASQVLETDEFDICRCLSDKEGDLNVQRSEPSKSCQSLEINADGESKENAFSHVQFSFAESISIDGDGLSRSEDSDWNLCYKGNTFEV